MAARPPLRRAGWRHHAAQHDQLSRLAGASRLLAAPQVRAISRSPKVALMLQSAAEVRGEFGAWRQPPSRAN